MPDIILIIIKSISVTWFWSSLSQQRKGKVIKRPLKLPTAPSPILFTTNVKVAYGKNKTREKNKASRLSPGTAERSER